MPAIPVTDGGEPDQWSPPGGGSGRLESGLDQLLTWPKANPDNERFAGHLARHQDDIYTFLYDPTIDATNWRGEQAIRQPWSTERFGAATEPRRAQKRNRSSCRCFAPVLNKGAMSSALSVHGCAASGWDWMVHRQAPEAGVIPIR